MGIRKIFTRDFTLAFLGLFTLSSVYNILVPTLPLHLSKQGSTETEIGVLIGSFGFSSLILRPLVGRLLLKILEKKIMLAGSILYALTSLAYILAPPFWPFLIVRVLQGIGFAFFHTASFTLIANISSETRRGQSLSYFIIAFNLSGALAPSLGMVLINHFSFSMLFWVCSVLSLCTLVLTSQLGKRELAPWRDSTIEKGFFFNREIFLPSLTSSLSLFTWGALAAFFPLYAIEHGVTNPGLFFTTIAIMLFLGRALGGKILDQYRKERIILPCLVTYVVSMVLLGFSETLPMFILVAVIMGAGHAFLIPAVLASVLDSAGSSPGPALGTFHAITDLGMSLGPVIMGMVLHATGYPTMFFSLAFLGLINLSYFYLSCRKKENTG